MNNCTCVGLVKVPPYCTCVGLVKVPPYCTCVGLVKVPPYCTCVGLVKVPPYCTCVGLVMIPPVGHRYYKILMCLSIACPTGSVRGWKGPNRGFEET